MRKTEYMQTKELPKSVRLVEVVRVDEDIYSVNILINKPVFEGNNTKTDWDIEMFCNHLTGMMYAPLTHPSASKVIRRKIESNPDFDAEYHYYKILAKHVL